MEKQKSIFKYVFLIFAAVIIIADVCLILMHDRKFSENENRMLQTFPAPTRSTLVSGRYMEEAEDFVADQFFLRDQWIGFKLVLDKAQGKSESNDVYLGKNGYLVEKAVVPNMVSMAKNLDAIKQFSLNHDCNIVMSVVPNAVCACPQLLPANAPTPDQRVQINYIAGYLKDSLTFADVTDDLAAHSDEYIYYKSDHHWTSLGAKYAFESMADELQLDQPLADYVEMEAAEGFSGTMASKSGAFNVSDTVDIYVPRTDGLEYYVEYPDIQKKSATIFNSEALNEKNKYEVFLGGNHPYISIKTIMPSDRNLLIFKDSYANAFIQFLLPYYRNIVVIDPRYYSDDIEKLIEERNITDILFLYNMNTFALDNSLAGVLEN